MTSPNIQDQVPGNLTIPTLPDVVMRVQGLVNDPNAGMKDIGEVIAKDAPLLARVLKMANSAYFGMAGRCTSADQACTVLGARVVGNIVMQVGIMQAFQHLEDMDSIRAIWDHSVRTAELSAFLTKRVTTHRMLDASDFYTYGLLHDLGKIVLIETLGQEYMALVHRAGTGDVELVHLEQEELGYDHAQVGALVALRWALPETVQHTLQFHHGPIDQVKSDPQIGIVYTANRLANAAIRADGQRLLGVLRESAVASLGLDESKDMEVIDAALGREPAEPG